MSKILKTIIQAITEDGREWEYKKKTTPVKGNDNRIVTETISVILGLDAYLFVKTTHHTPTTESLPKFSMSFQRYNEVSYTNLYNEDHGLRSGVIQAIKTLMETKSPLIKLAMDKVNNSQEEHKILFNTIQVLKEKGTLWSVEDTVTETGSIKTLTGYYDDTIFIFKNIKDTTRTLHLDEDSYSLSINYPNDFDLVVELYSKGSVNSILVDQAIREIIYTKLLVVREAEHKDLEERKTKIFSNLKLLVAKVKKDD